VFILICMSTVAQEIINMWSEQLERNADTFTTEAVKGTDECSPW
jgi:hypothetical protein